jgi:HAD superfamily hydrolase (TIGR01450 family)
VDELLARYQVFLLDAYGVLVTADDALPGAAEFLARLRAAGKDWLILSNDASRSPASSERRYRSFGLEVEADRILTSGMLLKDYFANAHLGQKRCIVLGTADSRDYVTDAGGAVVPADDDSAEVIVVADDDDYPFLPTVNQAVTVMLRRAERRARTWYVLPNPDSIYPRRGGSFGITAGAIAVMLEAVARARACGDEVRFEPLGKPHRPMFEAAARRFPERPRAEMVMLGDQLGTDILGANRFGIDSALVETGVDRWLERGGETPRPSYLLAGFWPDGGGKADLMPQEPCPARSS